jgi:hypothetical protein
MVKENFYSGNRSESERISVNRFCRSFKMVYFDEKAKGESLKKRGNLCSA